MRPPLSIRALLTLVVAVSVVLTHGFIPVGGVLLALFDHDHDVEMTLEHGVVHLRVADAHDHAMDAHGSATFVEQSVDIVEVQGPLHDVHGAHIPRASEVRVISVSATLLPALASSHVFDHLLASPLAPAAASICSIPPGIEHRLPPELQHTVILLI